MFEQADEQNVLWCAQMMQRVRMPGLNGILLRRIPRLAAGTQTALLELLSPQAGTDASHVLAALSAQGDPHLTLTVLLTLQLVVECQQKVNPSRLVPLTWHANPHIRNLACSLGRQAGVWPREDRRVDVGLSLPSVILLLKKIEIFGQLTATIRTLQACRMLMLHKQEFKEMVREFPQIALNICKVLGGRIRRLHTKMTH